MMEWIKIETGSEGLELFTREGEFLVNVDGKELMSSYCHVSEDALAIVSRRCTNVVRPEIMIGGLGLGFTLAAFIKEFGDEAGLTIVEKSPDIIHWFSTYTKRISLGDLDDSEVNFICSDISKYNPEKRFDIIALDVDNGPEAICGVHNETLYDRPGLRRIFNQLNPGGSLLLWSAFNSESYVEDARQSGFEVTTEVVDIPEAGWTHYIFICKKV
jgi:spermidine synthase